MGGDPRPFSISSLSRIYLPWQVLTDLSEMLLGAEMINVLCYVDVRGVLFSKWELFVTPQSWPSLSSGYVPFCGRTEAVISHYWDLPNSSFQSALSQRLTFYIETDKRIITVSETIKLSRRNYPTLVSCVCFPDYLNIKTFPSSCQVVRCLVSAAANKSIRRAPRKSCRHSIHHT